MKQILEEKIEETRARCKEKLQQYQTQTEGITADYRMLLRDDAKLSKKVERKLREVERMQASIQHWKLKIAQNRQECEERNCNKSLKDQLSLAERILKTAELCRKFETEREKVLPFYLSREVEVEELQFDDDDLKEEIKESLADTGIDEWTYLDTFFKRYNKVKLDHLAIDKERQRLEKENVQLRSILKQFLDGVSVNEDVLSQPNPLLVVNGKVNLNHIPVKRAHEKKVVIEAAHHVQTSVQM